MQNNNIRVFLASGELILDLIKKESNLPEDAELIKVELQPSLTEARNESFFNVLRFIIKSKEYSPVLEGCVIPKVDIQTT